MRKLISKLRNLELIKTEKQKDNYSKYFYDLSKIILVVTVIAPIAKPETFNIHLFIGGLLASILLFIFGSLIDRKEVKK